jgi:hypothetical protein
MKNTYHKALYDLHTPAQYLIVETPGAGHTIPDQVNVLEYAIDMLDESRNVENNSGSWQKLFETAESGATLTLECTFDLENASPLSAGADQCDKTSHNNQRGKFLHNSWFLNRF